MSLSGVIHAQSYRGDPEPSSRARRPTHNAPELLDRLNPFMEMQVNLAADNGEKVDGKRGTYTDGEFTWWQHPHPEERTGEPEFQDYEIRWPLELHVEV